MKAVVALLIDRYLTIKSQFQTVLKGLLDKELVKFIAVSKNNPDNIVITLNQELDSSEIEKFNEELSSDDFHFSYRNNLIPNTKVPRQSNVSGKPLNPIITLCSKSSVDFNDLLDA